jgi:hypothetical protein
MAALGLSPPLLFKTAAALNAIYVPLHILFGLNEIHPVISAMPTVRQKDKAGKRSAQVGFNYVNGGLIIAGKFSDLDFGDALTLMACLALLNYKWSKEGGPRSLEEKMILWTIVLNGGVAAYTYALAGLYAAWGCHVVAPLCSAAALVLF